jgi:hypothetical protein
MMRITSELKKIGALGIILAITGLLGTIASIIADFGIPGVVASIAIALFIFLFCLSILRPILGRNKRGVTLLGAITNVGLVDIENRDDGDHLLPPTEFYDAAKQEIAIVAISAFHTFDHHLDCLHRALDKGIDVFVMLLHPDSLDIPQLSIREGHDIKRQIEDAVEIIAVSGLNQHPGFQMKFTQQLPTYTAVMIDGDLFQTGKQPRDTEGQIRVQPRSVHKSHHHGIVLQLKKTKSEPNGGFDFFAEDLRQQWCEDGLDAPELFKTPSRSKSG